MQPSDAAATSSEGAFKVTKPGVYVGTVRWYQRAQPPIATTRVCVTEAGLTATTEVTIILSGQVSDDGQVAASGTATSTVTGVGSNSTPMMLSGQISGGTFTGKLVGSGGKSVEVTATRQ